MSAEQPAKGLNAQLIKVWTTWGTRFLPFADVATPELPLSRLLRLSLIQVSVGISLVLLVGTLNRVMIVELGVPASVVGVMLALPLLAALFESVIGAIYLVVFTDQTGSYRLTGVPSGPTVLEVFFTGLDPLQLPVTIRAGDVVDQDISLTNSARYGTDASGTVKLDSFVVATARETDSAAIAINEQRFAANIVTVVAADEFGVVPDGNIGEFLKMLPGITMDYRGGDPREISMNGVSSANVPVTIGGFALASSEVSGAGRNVELNAISINNLSRIEAVYSPTPETPGSALAGSVNMIPRSAFERSRPIFSGSVYLTARDSSLEGRTEGPSRRDTPTWKVRPGFEFSWVVPVNRTFGFTVSAGASSQYSSEPFMQNTWRGAGAVTNGTTLPDTTPGRPYLSDYLYRDSTVGRDRTAFGATVDYRLGRRPVGDERTILGLSLVAAATAALVRLMWGALLPGREGGLLNARLRYFDPEQKRAGMPDDVGALVSGMSDTRTVITCSVRSRMIS